MARAELSAEVSRTLIASLNTELTDVYPEPGANHFQLRHAPGSPPLTPPGRVTWRRRR